MTKQILHGYIKECQFGCYECNYLPRRSAPTTSHFFYRRRTMISTKTKLSITANVLMLQHSESLGNTWSTLATIRTLFRSESSSSQGVKLSLVQDWLLLILIAGYRWWLVAARHKRKIAHHILKTIRKHYLDCAQLEEYLVATVGPQSLLCSASALVELLVSPVGFL